MWPIANPLGHKIEYESYHLANKFNTATLRLCEKSYTRDLYARNAFRWCKGFFRLFFEHS